MGKCDATFTLSFVLLTQETDDSETETVKVSTPPKDTTPPKKSSNYPNPHLILTIISLVLCTSILNFFSYICLIPALISSRKVRATAYMYLHCSLCLPLMFLSGGLDILMSLFEVSPWNISLPNVCAFVRKTSILLPAASGHWGAKQSLIVLLFYVLD